MLTCLGLADVALTASGGNDLDPADMHTAIEAAALGRDVSIIWLLKDEFYSFYLPSNVAVSTMGPVTAPVIALTVIMS